MTLPPPPAGYDPAIPIHRLKPAAPPATTVKPGTPPAAHRVLTPVIEESDLGEAQEDLPMPPPPDSDYDEDALAKDVGGRPSIEQASRVVQFVQVVRDLALAFGQATGLHSDRFLSALVRSMPNRKGRAGNGWNIYEGFARSEEHAVEEYRRIEPTFDPTTMALPQLSTMDLSAMYKKFQEAYPEGEAEALLEKYAEWTQLGVDETMASRQRQFDRICKGLQASVRVLFFPFCQQFILRLPQIDAANERDFEAIIFICGACVHEDAELGRVITTPALQTAVSVFFPLLPLMLMFFLVHWVADACDDRPAPHQ
jgi:hypothetical protein